MNYNIIAVFISPTGHKQITLFEGPEELAETRTKFPEAAVRVWSTTGHITSEELTLLQLAIQRAGRGIYGSRVVEQLYGINDYREGRLGR